MNDDDATAQAASDARKRAAIKRSCELDRRGLIEHDWSEVATTGMVKVRVKLEAMEPPSSSTN
jgi:hypothetical protein